MGRQLYIASNVAASMRGTVSSIVAGTTRLGTALGPMLGGQAAQRLGTPSAFYLEALFAGAAGLAIQAFTRGSGEVASGSSSGASSLLDFPRRAMLIAPVLVALSFVRAARELLLPLKSDLLGLDLGQIGYMMAASFGVDTACVPLAGYIMDTHGRRVAGAAALLISAVGFALLR